MSNHFEGLGKTWLTLLNDPEKEVPAVVMQVMKEGKTRDCWQRKDSKEETMVLAWPVETGFRAGVTVHGNAGDQLRPVSTYPLLEGAPNDMTVNETYLWQNETEGEVSATCTASNTEIDEWGISHALGVAALRALAQAEAKLGIDGNGMLSGKPVKVGAILDGPNDYITKTLNTFDAPEVPVPANVTTKVKGDRYCAAVAAAAVIAKVTRDRLMVELGAQPQYEPYEWAHNKGYGSAAHRDAIAEFGPSDLHRLSWHLV